MDMLVLVGKLKLEKMNKITKFVVNLPKIMEKAKEFQNMTLIIIEIGQ